MARKNAPRRGKKQTLSDVSKGFLYMADHHPDMDPSNLASQSGLALHETLAHIGQRSKAPSSKFLTQRQQDERLAVLKAGQPTE